MEQSSQRPQTPSRRGTVPYPEHHQHQHQHTQPKYASPDYRSQRRHTDPQSEGASLSRVHSRPEDWKNLPRNGKLFEYICFEGGDVPQEADEMDHDSNKSSKQPEKAPIKEDKYKPQLIDEEDEGYESEDELTLPSTYHHDVGHRDDEWHGGYKHRTASPDQTCEHELHEHRSIPRVHESQRRTPFRQQPQQRRDSAYQSNSSSDSPPLSRTGSSSDPHAPDTHIDGKQLIAQVAQHLQSHKDGYNNRDTKQLVSELLGEVMRKVADGGLDSHLMREVVKEVQHVL